MKSRKLIWIAALCVLSATVITVSLRARSAGVLAAQHSVSRASLAQPAAYMSNASLRAAAVSNAMLLDDDGGPTRVTGSQQGRPVLPLVQEFTLTPPDPAQGLTKTVLSVRFPELPAAKLASRIPFTLGKQNVVLQRSPADPSIFSTSVDFDWQAFAQEQEQRKEAASRGRVVPVFQGHRLVRWETMQFVDPAKIQGALQSHRPIQFSGDVLLSSSLVTVVPDHELMMTNTAVVQDTEPGTSNGRTYDSCLALLTPPQAPGNPTGAWTLPS